MDLELGGTIAFISGSSRGIGRGIAERFLDEGARVTITGRDAVTLEATKMAMAKTYEADRIFTFAGDLTDEVTVRRALDAADTKWGKLDHLVANLGSGQSIAGWAVGSVEWDRVFALNIRSAVLLVEAALPRLLDRPGATVTLVGSIAGLEAMNAPLPYSTAKTALASYGAALARNVAGRGVRVNTVAPGNILFPGGVWGEKLANEPQKVEAYIEAEVPLKRFGTPEEIANLVVFLSSARATFITGTCVTADGGQTRMLI